MSRYLSLCCFCFLWINRSVMADPTYHFELACTAKLFSQNESVDLVSETQLGEATDSKDLFITSTLQMGPYTLYAEHSLAQPEEAGQLEPTFSMMLYKGNPVSGKVNATAVQGLDLNRRAAHQPIHFYGNSFVSFNYKDKKITRIDYTCSIDKVEETNARSTY